MDVPDEPLVSIDSGERKARERARRSVADLRVGWESVFALPRLQRSGGGRATSGFRQNLLLLESVRGDMGTPDIETATVKWHELTNTKQALGDELE